MLRQKNSQDMDGRVATLMTREFIPALLAKATTALWGTFPALVCACTHTHTHNLSPGHPEICVNHTMCQFNNVLRMIRYNIQASSLVFLSVSILDHYFWICLLFIVLPITLYFIQGMGVSFKHDSDEFHPQRVVEMLGSLRFRNGDLRLSGRRLLGNFFQYFFLVM